TIILFSLSLSSDVPSILLFFSLSLHDALPIFARGWRFDIAFVYQPLYYCTFHPVDDPLQLRVYAAQARWTHRRFCWGYPRGAARSEEHTSELQSRENLVCRLLLEKKKNAQNTI